MAWRRPQHGRHSDSDEDDEDEEVARAPTVDLCLTTPQDLDEDGSEEGSHDSHSHEHEHEHDQEEEESSSHVSFEACKTPTADWGKLAALLRRLSSHDAVLVLDDNVREVCRELNQWASLLANDKARGIDATNATFLAALAPGDDERALALNVYNAILLLLQSRDAEESLSHLLHFADTIPSTAERRMENLEAGKEAEDTAPSVPFQCLWQTLDAAAAQLHPALTAKLAELVAGSVSHYVVQQVICIDRLRDVWIRLMLNWLLSHKGQLSKLEHYDVFLGFPQRCPHMGTTLMDPEGE
jgi:hypothetical protein